MQLKDYQSRAKQALSEYLSDARIFGPKQAFEKYVAKNGAKNISRQYNEIEGLKDAPYVCLRLPTGGGKTLLAAHSIETAAKTYLEQQYPLVLWMVPTKTIQSQTLDALKKPGHPYRAPLDELFNGRVGVYDITEVTQIRPKDMQEKLCIVVSTFASLRVEDRGDRKVYSDNENFEPHFTKLLNLLKQKNESLDKKEDGKVKQSFANLVNLKGPLIIIDEAHNARTPLTFDVLKNIRPACIIEFTATPDRTQKSGSNILFHVSASELKAEDMIKLPIILTEHKSWQEALHHSVLTRNKLAEYTKDETEYIRPILLIQAESKDRELTVEVVKKHLLENENIATEKIAIATGSQRELDEVDLFDAKCPIEIIITIEALKEGWDCSFAYVFCSVANIRSNREVEQLLGRVMRMPYAVRRANDHLNKAYAHASSQYFCEAARQLEACLQDMGFDEQEIQENLQQNFDLGDEALFEQPKVVKLEIDVTYANKPFDELKVKEAGFELIKEGETTKLVVTGLLAEETKDELLTHFSGESKEHIKYQLRLHQQQQAILISPSRQGIKFSAPRLCLNIQGELELLEPETIFELQPWDLLKYSAELTESEFTASDDAKTFEFDIDGNKLVWSAVDHQTEIEFSRTSGTLNEFDFIRFLDHNLKQPDIRQEAMLEFLRRAVQYLKDVRKIDIATLDLLKYPLAKKLAEKIARYRQQAMNQAFETTLFGANAPVETTYKYDFSFSNEIYPANWFYNGRYKFKKHFYPFPGELESSGEEFDCAQALDNIPKIKHWVRNLAKQRQYAFWLPTSTDLFYPDFVAELEDGRVLVVEYKGAQIATTDDTKEKQNIGLLWESKSKSKGLFLMAQKKDEKGRDVYGQIMEKITR